MNAPMPTPSEVITVLRAALERPYASAVLERRYSEAIIQYLERYVKEHTDDGSAP